MSRKCAATAYTDGIAREHSGKTIGAAIIRQGGKRMSEEKMTASLSIDAKYVEERLKDLSSTGDSMTKSAKWTIVR